MFARMMASDYGWSTKMMLNVMFDDDVKCDVCQIEMFNVGNGYVSFNEIGGILLVAPSHSSY